MKLLLALALAPFPALAAEVPSDAAVAEQVAAPIREASLDKMAAYKPILFPAGVSDEVTDKYGAPFAALEATIRSQRHPGDLARSNWKLKDLLDEALKARHRLSRGAGTFNGGLGEFKAAAAKTAEAGALAASSARESSKRAAELAAALAASIPAADLSALMTATAVELPPPPAQPAPPSLASVEAGVPPLDLSALFKTDLTLPEPPPPAPAPAAEIATIPSKPMIAVVDLKAPLGNLPVVTDRFAIVRQLLISRGAQASVVDAALATAKRENFDPILLLALGKTESSLRSSATSHKAAMGPTQMLRTTAGQYNAEILTKPELLYNSHVAFDVTVDHLRYLAGRFAGGDSLKNFDPNAASSNKLLASWNAGEGAVIRHAGVPPYKETIDFVARVKANYKWLKDTLLGGR